MPTEKAVERAKRDLAQGKPPSTAAGEFVREEMERMKSGPRGAHSREQAIAIGLSKARRAGVPLRPQKLSGAQERTQRSMAGAYAAGQRQGKPPKPAKRGGKR